MFFAIFLLPLVTSADLVCVVFNRNTSTVLCRSSAQLPDKNNFKYKYIYVEEDLLSPTKPFYKELIEERESCAHPCEPKQKPCEDYDENGCRCDWKYLNVTNSCYQIFPTSGLSFSSAVRDCVLRNADLSSIHSELENEFIAEISGTASRFGVEDHTWIGLYKEDESWKWIDGSSYAFSYWWTGQPDNHLGSEGCVQLRNWDYSKEQRWNDVSCERKLKKHVSSGDPTGVFDSRARNAGVRAVLEKIISSLNEFEFEMEATCEKNLARLDALKKNKSDSSGSLSSNQNGSRTPSRKNSATALSNKENSAQNESGICLRFRNLPSTCVQQRLNTIENKVNLIMSKLGEMSVNTGNTLTRKVSAYEASVHGCHEIQHAIEVLEKAVDNELEGLPSVYASIISRNSLGHRHELQNLAAHLTDFVDRLKNSKVSYDRIVESYEDCLACSSNSRLYNGNKE